MGNASVSGRIPPKTGWLVSLIVGIGKILGVFEPFLKLQQLLLHLIIIKKGGGGDFERGGGGGGLHMDPTLKSRKLFSAQNQANN